MLKAYIWWQNLKNEKGQGMVEYGLIIAVVALVAVVGLTSLGTELSSFFTTLKAKFTTTTGTTGG